MKPRNSTPFRSHASITAAFSVALFSHFAAPSASAQAIYWDNNNTTAGFGTAGGTWTSTATLWSSSAAGTDAVSGTLASTTSNTVNFGTGALGLAAGTITVTGTVDAGNITFDDNSGNIILSTGTISLGAAATINNGGNTNTINSALSGAGTSLAFTGGGTVIFTGAGAAGFGAGLSATVSGSTILRFSAGGTGALGGSTGFNIALGNATTGGTLAIGNSGTVANQITVGAGTGTRALSNSGSPSGTFSGTIIANENLAVNNSGSNSINTTGGASSTIASAKTVTYTSSSGSMTNSTLFGGLGGIAYTASSTGNITVSGAKTYSGATTLGAMTGTGAVLVSTSSTGPANAPTDGAFGTGTLTIGATKVRAGTTADITVGNPITFSGNPTFTTIASEKSLIFSGNASLAATRTLTVDTGGTVAGSAVRFGGIISGVGFGITKAGAGELRLSGVNTYSGATTLNAGKLVGVVGGSNSSSTVNLNNIAATLGVSVADNTLSWTCSALTSSASGVLEFNYGAVTPSTTVSPLVVTNLSAFTDTPSVSVVVDAGLPVGIYPLVTWGTTSGIAPTSVAVSNVTPGTFASLSVSGNTLRLEITAGSNIVIKDDNTNALSLGTSWVGGVAPDSLKIAKWNSTVMSANTTVLGADVTWAGIVIENPTGLVTINAGNTLTLGTALTDIDMSTADTAGLTLNCALAMSGDNRWDVAASRTLTLGGQVSGAFDVHKLGAGTATLSSGANSYSGSTNISAGTLKLGASNVIPNGAAIGNVSVAGTLDLNGNDETVNGLSGAGIIDNLADTTTSTFTVGGNNQSSTFSGILKNTGASATLNLIKTGTNALTLSGANTFTGITTVSGGTLILSHASALSGTTGITLAGGTTLTPGLSGITINKPITLGTLGTTATITAPDVAGSGTTAFPVTLSDAISGDGNVSFNGISTTNAYGNINLNAASNYAGSTLITTVAANNNANIFVNLGVTNALPVTTVVTLDGGDGTGGGRFCELDLNGKNQTLAGLTNVTGRTLRTQRVNNTSSTAATLTVNNTADYTFAAPLGSGGTNFALTKSGTGIFTVSGARTYSGNTTANNGTLRLGTANPSDDLSTVTIGATGILQLDYAGTDAVNKFFIGATQQSAGTYGHTSTGATNGGLGVGALDAYFVTGTGTLTVTTGPGYSSWKTANSTVQTIDLDHDSDGVSNGVEYFLGGNTNTTGFTALPGVTNTAGILSITWTKAASYTGTYGTDFWVETSSTLSGAWTTETSGVNVTFPSATEVKYTFPAGTTNFARLKVTGP